MTKIFPEAPSLPKSFKAYGYQGSDPDECAQWVRWNEYYYHLGMVLMKVDRASMRHSVEVRVPLLDREVIDVASRVDWKSCLDLKNNMGKIPLRKSLAKHIAFQTKSKKGFNVPMGEWLRGPLKNKIREVLLAKSEICGIRINKPIIEGIIDKHANRESESTRGLWNLLSLALWADFYKD